MPRELGRSWTYGRRVWGHIYGVNAGYFHWFTYCATLKLCRSCIGLALLTVASAYFPCLAEASLSKRDYENAKLLYRIRTQESRFLYCHVYIYICNLATLELDLCKLLGSFTFP